MYCRAATEGKTLSVDGADHGAMQGARLCAMRGYAPMRPRASCARIRATRERAGHMRGMRAGGSIIGMGARDHFPPTRPFERANMSQARTTLRACEDVPSAHDPSGVHDLFPRGIPLIPLNPAESHLKLVFRSDREPAHVDGIHVGREETGVGVLCCEIALAGERSEPPGSGIFAAIPNGVESTSFGCRKPGSTGLPTARYSRPQHCESRAFAVVSGA